MGGHGSGIHNCRGASRVSQLPKLSLAWLRRNGNLVEGTQSTVTWDVGGDEIVAIRLEAVHGGMNYTYTMILDDGDTHDISEFIPYAYAPTNFGGQRLCLRCPLCQRKCTDLYFDQRLRCRKCHGATFDSQYANAMDRLRLKMEKIRRRLSPEGDLSVFPDKPARMRWTTYRRLENADEGMQMEWFAALQRLMSPVRN